MKSTQREGLSIQRRGWIAGGMMALSSVGLTAQRSEEVDHTGGDPMGSMAWPGLRSEFMGDDPMEFSNSVSIQGPSFADDAMNVPLLLDARKLASSARGIELIRVVVDRNPVRHVLDFEPLRAMPMLAFRIRMEQASPVRAMVKTEDGRWYVGSTWVQAAGGGCTVPGITRADGSWSRTLNQVQARIFSNVVEGSKRLRVRIMHPMDTGLVAGTPAFFIDELRLVDVSGQVWWRLSPHEPLSENPLITLELPMHLPVGLRLLGRDNNGNAINAEVQL